MPQILHGVRTYPKLSVLIPTYNSEKYITECLTSVFNQKNVDWSEIEIFVIDNSSSDKTCELVKKFEESVQFTKFIKNVPNIYKNSCQEAIEIFYKKAKGEWLTWIFSDDFIGENYFENIIKVANKLYQKYQVFQSKMQTFNGTNYQELEHKYADLEEFKSIFLTKSPVNTPTVVYHRDLIPEFKFDNGTLNGAGDYKIWGDLATKGILIYPIPLFLGYYYRIHASQCTWEVHRDAAREGISKDKLIQEYFREKWRLAI